MPVEFEELAGSPSGTFSNGKFSGTRQFKVAWEDYTTFIGELYGVYSLTGGTVSSTSPATFPGIPQAVCTDIKFNPQSGLAPTKSGVITLTNGNAVTYSHAIVTAAYKIPFSSGGSGRSNLPPVPEGTYLDFSSDRGAEYTTIPGRTWVWTGSSVPVPADSGPSVILPTEEITLTWSRVTSPPWSAIELTKGKVNDETFLNYEAGKLLFAGARTRKSFQITEQTFWTVDYSFRARSEEWNKSYNEGTGVLVAGWTEIEDAESNPPYASASYSGLFQFE